MKELIDHLKDSLSNTFKRTRTCKLNENNGALTLECFYQRPNRQITTYSLNQILLKIVVNVELQICIAIIELHAEKDINPTAIRMKKNLVDNLYKIVNTNIHSDLIGGNNILLAWDLSINNEVEVEQAIVKVKKIVDHIFRKYTLPKRGSINI